MSAYYNEHDAFAAAWLRELIKAGLISDGEVDERDIQQVEPGDLRGFTQCHFFAGIGVWSYALRNAGWPDDLAVWTGSCPCQGFSASGKRGGFSDQRHLWPAWFRLIAECRPDTVFGEQVASKDGLAWFDVVSADLEGTGYAVGAADTCAAGFGAPHIRSRLYFVADTGREQYARRQFIAEGQQLGRGDARREPAPCGNAGTVADALRERGQQKRGSASGDEAAHGRARRHGSEPDGNHIAASDSQAGQLADTELPDRRPEQEVNRDSHWRPGLGWRSATGELGHAALIGRGEGRPEPARLEGRLDAAESGSDDKLVLAERTRLEGFAGDGDDRNESRWLRAREAGSVAAPGLTNGFWRDAEWLWCRDGKYRPVESGTFPLAHWIAKRVGKLRGFGNAIVAPQAEEFIRAAMDVRTGRPGEGAAWKPRKKKGPNV